MTIDQLNTLSDEEVRVRVARVMDWRIDDPPEYEDGALMGHIQDGADGWMRWDMVPEFVTDLNAAFTLVEKLRGEGWVVRVDNGLNCSFGCTFSREVDPSTKPENAAYYRDQCEWREEHYGVADTASRAICLSFLAVTEREEG